MGFSQTEYSFNENGGGMVCVVLLGGTIQSVVSVILTLNATDGSATGIIIYESDSDVIDENNMGLHWIVGPVAYIIGLVHGVPTELSVKLTIL